MATILQTQLALRSYILLTLGIILACVGSSRSALALGELEVGGIYYELSDDFAERVPVHNLAIYSGFHCTCGHCPLPKTIISGLQ